MSCCIALSCRRELALTLAATYVSERVLLKIRIVRFMISRDWWENNKATNPHFCFSACEAHVVVLWETASDATEPVAASNTDKALVSDHGAADCAQLPDPLRQYRFQYYFLAEAASMNKVQDAVVKNCLNKMENVHSIWLSDPVALCLLAWVLDQGRTTEYTLTRLGTTRSLPWLFRCSMRESPLVDFSYMMEAASKDLMGSMDKSTLRAKIVVNTSPEKTIQELQMEQSLEHHEQVLHEWEFAVPGLQQ